MLLLPVAAGIHNNLVGQIKLLGAGLELRDRLLTASISSCLVSSRLVSPAHLGHARRPLGCADVGTSPSGAVAPAGRADFVGSSGWAAARVVRWRVESSYVLCYYRLG
jgi:hypothetical protein